MDAVRHKNRKQPHPGEPDVALCERVPSVADCIKVGEVERSCKRISHRWPMPSRLRNVSRCKSRNVASAHALACVTLFLFERIDGHTHCDAKNALMNNLQVASGDSWASVLTRGLMSSEDVEGHGVNPATVAIFFSSYVLVVGVVLMNIVVAVLLDGEHFMSVHAFLCLLVRKPMVRQGSNLAGICCNI